VGRVVSESTREKLRAARTGKHTEFSNPEERAEKLSVAMTNRNNSNPEIMQKMRNASVLKCSKPIIQKDLDGKEIAVWKSAAEIQRVIGFGRAQISRACHSNGKPYSGYLWEFYDK
jgi:hypothetical protein